MFTNRQVGDVIIGYGLGKAIDAVIEPQEIKDKELSEMWAEAQVVMNNIQLYMEQKLGVKFFNKE